MARDYFELEIVRPLESMTLPVRWIDVDGTESNFLVGPAHSPLVSLLKPKGIVRYKGLEGEVVNLNVFGGGIISVANNKATIILEE